MAAVTQPGSRGGLITSLIVFIVLFFVAAVLAIVSFSDKKNLEKANLDLKNTYEKAIKRSEMADPQFTEVTGDSNNRGRSWFEVMIQQRDELGRTITGQSNVQAATAIANATGAIDAANKALQPTGTSVPGGGLTQAVAVLTREIMNRQSQIADLQTKLAMAGVDYKKQVDTYKKELDQHRTSVEAAKGEASKAVQDTTQYRASKDEQVGQLEKNLQEAIERGRKTAEDLTTQVTGAKQEIEKLQKERTRLLAIVERSRPREVGEAMMRQAAGHIKQIGPNRVCYIDLGLGQGISPGMTFEVYDKLEGMPRISTTQDDQLPIGKASIEVIHVSSLSSECRIVRLSPGMHLQEGDMIANLVYDPNVKRRFFSFGLFDMDQNGVATAQEGEIVKRLIVQWGGQVVDKIDVDTDFVVLGKEPTLPPYTKDELENDAIKKFNYEKAEQAVKAYEEMRNKAVELHIPVLNQTRFLYLIGYYDQSKK